MSASGSGRSWAEDAKSYRSTYGSRSLSAVGSAVDVPPRYSRTTYVPFADTKHPLYSYNDFTDGQDQCRHDPYIQHDKNFRNGLGDTTLLKEEGFSGTLHARGQPEKGGKGQPEKPGGKDGRMDLFSTLQQSSANMTPDSWIGNQLINPTKGKGVVEVPPDPKGRKDLFDVLQARSPGMPSDDSWLGHSLIDPAKGKAHPMGPEQRRGRRDLGEVYNQQILRETKQRQLELMSDNGKHDPYCDGWLGNRLVHPVSGKMPVDGNKASEVILTGATFRNVPEDHSDMPRRHQRIVPPPIEECMMGVLNGTQAGADDFGRRGKGWVEEPKGHSKLPRDDNLYAHMTYRDLSLNEKSSLTKGYNDGRHPTRKTLKAPRSEGPGQGSDMLHWKPEQRVASYVPFAGLCQEQRSHRGFSAAVTPAGSLANTLARK